MGEPGAIIEDDAITHLVSGAELGDLLARLDVLLVLLEACRSAGLSDQPVFGSLAPALLDQGVGSVLAFSHAVHVKAARLLVERFYRELADGLTIGEALQESRAALHSDRRRWALSAHFCERSQPARPSRRRRWGYRRRSPRFWRRWSGIWGNEQAGE